MEPAGIILCVSHLMAALLIWAISEPLVKRQVGPNNWYGFRYGKAMRSEAAWYDINEYGGRRMQRWWAPIAVAGLLALVVPINNPWVALPIALMPIGTVWSGVETWRYQRRYEEPN